MSAKTPNLFDVPKTHPSRKQRIEAFKKETGIETFDSRSYDEDFQRWTAAHMPSVYTLGYGVKEGMSLPECASLVCRLMDESGYCMTGPNEAEAIRRLCTNLNITCPL